VAGFFTVAPFSGNALVSPDVTLNLVNGWAWGLLLLPFSFRLGADERLEFFSWFAHKYTKAANDRRSKGACP